MPSAEMVEDDDLAGELVPMPDEVVEVEVTVPTGPIGVPGCDEGEDEQDD